MEFDVDRYGSPRNMAIKIVLWMLLFLLIGVAGDYAASRFGLEKDLLYVNDVISALIIGALVFSNERRRRRRVLQRLEIIQLMNHHVRNALQVIAFTPHTAQREENIAQIDEAVKRIEWALREILPGDLPLSPEDLAKERTSQSIQRTHAS
jgi:hypothetical protein